MSKAKVGDMRPIYQQVGWEVCKKEAESTEDEEWIQTDQQAIAEIMSHNFKQNK